jgi:hypothetical protein
VQLSGALVGGREVCVAVDQAPLAVLVPEDVGHPQAHRLRRAAVYHPTGIEARVWLTDIAGLSSQQATQLMRWTARAIYRSALDESGPP